MASTALGSTAARGVQYKAENLFREYLETLGNINVSVCYGDQQVTLPLVVIKGKGPSLFRRNWLEKIKLDWPEIHKLQEDPVGAILRQHAIVFEESLGTERVHSSSAHKSSSQTKILQIKARTIPYAYRKWLMLN